MLSINGWSLLLIQYHSKLAMSATNNQQDTSSLARLLPASLRGNKNLLYGVTAGAAAVVVLGCWGYRRYARRRSQGSNSGSSIGKVDIETEAEDSSLERERKKAKKQKLSRDKRQGRKSRREDSDDSVMIDGKLRESFVRRSATQRRRNSNSSQSDVSDAKGRQRRQRAVYINSNDELYYLDEASFSHQGSDRERANGPHFSRGNRFLHKGATNPEEERRRIQEHINNKKKQEIKMFLEDVTEKRGRFLTQNKRSFKEDVSSQIVSGKTGPKREPSSTVLSDDIQLSSPAMSGRNFQARRAGGQGSPSADDGKQHVSINAASKLRSSNRRRISPSDFKDKGRNQWLNFFQMYTASYIQDGDKEVQRFRDQQYNQMIYGGQQAPSTSAGSQQSDKQLKKFGGAVIPSERRESVESTALQRRNDLNISSSKRAVSLD